MGSASVIGPIPERPAVSPSQKAATVSPSGVTAPMPVTTTRLRPFLANSVIFQALPKADACGSNSG